MQTEERRRSYQALRDKNPAWRLLGADRASLILACLAGLFDGKTDVPMDRARAELEILLEYEGFEDPSATARLYINDWVDSGWLREQNQQLTMTSAAQAALQFVEGLERRDLSATASHLETVQDEIKRLLVTLSPDIAEKQQLIDEQIQSLEEAKQRLLAGKTGPRTPAQRREQARHFYGLAVALTHDFRFLEDEMRRHESDIHRRILDEQENRGSVLGSVLDEEELMRHSPAGQAFDGFYAMLGDQDLSASFRNQVRRLMELGVAEYLSLDETLYLRDIVGRLLVQSERIISLRRAATESLRAYMLSGAQEEHRAVDRVLKALGQTVAALKNLAPPDWVGWNSPIDLTLTTGKLTLRSPVVLSLTSPNEDFEDIEVVEQTAKRQLQPDTLRQLSGLNVELVAGRIRAVLRQQGARTLGELAVLDPIKGGIEEVLALIRIAKATHATSLHASETIFVTDASHGLLKVQVPSLLLNADNFPEDLSEMNP